ncbi:MAG: methylmalonyl Co-A mutase-associated GTPase MeaB [Neomegalonema sp.]|nr:methylmalonyl Co-A mutase-associated GTPase MeaB [Neomegalonema sp.]
MKELSLAELRSGGKPALARALALIERRPEDPQTIALLDAAFAAPGGVVLGLTGPPGVGKSTLMDALIRAQRAGGHSIGIIAIDPSSSRSRGALLGDRTRLTTDPEDQGVFVRSMAARDRLGGLAALTYPAATLMRSVYDLVLIETVGVGQSETDIAAIADATVFCIQPGSGDALQFMKAGVMETPDLLLVTKADMGEVARRAAADAKGALSLTTHDGSEPAKVLTLSAQTGAGVNEALAAMQALAERRLRENPALRAAQARHWIEQMIRADFGRYGWQDAQRRQPKEESAAQAPFADLAALQRDLQAARANAPVN